MKFAYLAVFFFAMAAAQTLVTDMDNIPAGGVAVKIIDNSSGDFLRLLYNQKLFSDVSRATAAIFILEKNGNFITLKDTITNNYVSAEETGKKSLRATRTAARTWERFTATPTGTSGHYTLQSAANQKTVVTQSQQTLIANANPATLVGADTISYSFEIFQFTPATVSESISFIRNAGATFGGDDTTFAGGASNTAVTVTFQALTAQPTTQWTTYNLVATSNNKFLCYDPNNNGLISASCTDPTDPTTFFHFWAVTPTPSGLDKYIIANNLNHFAVLNSVDNKLYMYNQPRSAANNNFEITPVTPISGIYKVQHKATGRYLYAGASGQPATIKDAASNTAAQTITFTKSGNTNVFIIKYTSGSNNFYLSTNAQNALIFTRLNIAPTADAYKFYVRSAGFGQVIIMSLTAKNAGQPAGATPDGSNNLVLTDNTFSTGTVFILSGAKRSVVLEA